MLTVLLVIAAGLSSCCGPCRAVKPMEVRGERWGLLELNGKVIDRNSGSRPDWLTLTLGADGRIGGRGDCNGFSAAYSLENQLITIERIASTRILCPDQTLESDYFQALEKASSLKIDGDFLLLTDAAGKLVASFQRLK